MSHPALIPRSRIKAGGGKGSVAAGTEQVTNHIASPSNTSQNRQRTPLCWVAEHPGLPEEKEGSPGGAGWCWPMQSHAYKHPPAIENVPRFIFKMC